MLNKLINKDNANKWVILIVKINNKIRGLSS